MTEITWICDTCGGEIASAKDGWLEWLYDTESREAHSFRIVHHCAASPYWTGRESKPPWCYQHYGKSGLSDMHLDHFTGPSGERHMPWVGGLDALLGLMLEARDPSEVAEIIRRVQIPGYEQERAGQ